MNILVVSQYYKPDITAGAFRITETSEWLAAMGHQVHVLTAEPHRGFAREPADMASPEKCPSRLRLLRVPVRPMKGTGVPSYLIHYLSFMLRASMKGTSTVRSGWRPEIIWASSPPLFVGLVGVYLSWLMKSRLVLDVRDIWPDSAVGVGQLSKGGRAHRLSRRLELWLYRRAHAITCVSRSMAAYLRRHTDAPVEVIYNGCDMSLVADGSGATDPMVGIRVIRYVGNLGMAQALDTVIRAFARVLDERSIGKGWRLELVGTGSRENELKRLVYNLNLEHRVRFIPPVHKSRAAQLMSTADILVLNLRADAVFQHAVPSKLFDYMAAARPIVAALHGGEARALLQVGGGNIVSEADNEDSLMDALCKAIANINDLSRLAAHNRDLIEKLFNRRTQTKCLEMFFRSVAMNPAQTNNDGVGSSNSSQASHTHEGRR